MKEEKKVAGVGGERNSEGKKEKREGERERIVGSLWEFVIARSFAQRGRSKREEGERVDFGVETGIHWGEAIVY